MASTPTETASPSRVDRAEFTSYLADLFDVGAPKDACPNGLQVEGVESIGTVITGVSACLELFERASKQRADAVLVHHGIFWQGDDPVLVGVQRRRVGALVAANLNLYAYHLPLDLHPVLGNNAVAARGLGLQDVKPFGRFDGVPLGFSGLLPNVCDVDTFAEDLTRLFGREPQVFSGDRASVRSVALVSGAAERAFKEAIDTGIDAFVTGEASEWVVNLARESGTHFFAAGHYATERLGILALGEHLAERFGLTVRFEEIQNPV